MIVRLMSWLALCAFLATPASEHDYLTKAQALWFAMMDKKDYTRAFEFLLNLHRQALPEHLKEIREMINTSLRLTPSSARLSA